MTQVTGNIAYQKRVTYSTAIIFWWPFSSFEDVHWKKDPGSIPLELKKLGYNVILVVGVFHSKIKHKEIDIIETYDSKKQYPKFSIVDRLASIVMMFRLIYHYQPKSIIIEHSEIEAVVFALLVKLRFLIYGRRYPSLILKLDADPELIRKQNSKSLFVFYRYVYSAVFDKIICESKCALDQFVNPASILKYKHKCQVIPNGSYRKNTESNEARTVRKFNRILSVGRMSYQKGHDILIQIFAKIINKFPGWELRIVGLSDDQVYMEQLKKEIAELSLDNVVKIFTDLSDDQLTREYKEASIFCLLSRREGFSISRIEAIYYGLPLIITEAGCGIEYKKFGSFVCNINDHNCIINALETLISDENLRLKISEKQIAVIVTWHDVALKFSRLIESL